MILLEDETSTHLDVTSPLEKRLVQNQTVRQNPCCQVRFDERANVSHANRICLEDTKKLWYRSDDYRRFKDDLYKVSKQIIIADVDSFDRKGKGKNSYCNVLIRVFRGCLEAADDFNGLSLSTTLEKNFKKWITVTQSRTGVERLAVRKIHDDKLLRRRELTDTILDLQKIYKNYTWDEKARILSNASQEITRPSRVFAALLGSRGANLGICMHP